MTTQGKILVTGATGTVGGQLVGQLVYEVTGLVPRSICQWALDHAEAFR